MHLRLAFSLLLLTAVAAAQSSDLHLRVDAFGYRPLAKKIAVMREPLVGYDAPAGFTPSPVIELRRSSDDVAVYSAPALSWNGGAIHAQSGDRAWWFDFSSVETAGTYHVFDAGNAVRSEDFVIADDVYQGALREAVRVFFYQRSGFAKQTPFADARWSDGASHLGPQQDLDCRLVTNPTAATARDLSGGWFDAGDYNKYVNFADVVIHDLLFAYRATPDLWTDDFGLPESGNGTPDLLDELKWQLDWLLRMQSPDGSVLHKVSVTDFSAASPPSSDAAPRRYAPETASATLSACGAYAHAARVYKNVAGFAGYAAQLETAAVAAWDWLDANPSAIPSSYDNAGFQNVSAEDSAYEQSMNHVAAAVHLFGLTGDALFANFVDQNYQSAHLFQWFWASQWERAVFDTLLDYARTPGATATTSEDILDFVADRFTGPDHLPSQASAPDPYRSFLEDGDLGWGSNAIKAGRGMLYLQANLHGIDAGAAGTFIDIAEGYLHYLHGVNPAGYTYLTNMSGAPSSVTEMYHGWFADGSDWDSSVTSLFGPPPGFVVGGANPSYAPDPAYTGPALSPPTGQPDLKSYLDWNATWPENSWEVTEPSMTYQSIYVRLVSAFALRRPPLLGLDVPDLLAGTTATFRVGGLNPNATVAVLWSQQAGGFRVCLPIWCIDLGLTLLPNPLSSLLSLGVADAAGNYSVGIVTPSSVIGMDVLFQATQAGSGLRPVVSSVVAARVR